MGLLMVWNQCGCQLGPPRPITDRGHALVIDGGWREVADTALAFCPAVCLASNDGPRSPLS